VPSSTWSAGWTPPTQSRYKRVILCLLCCRNRQQGGKDEEDMAMASRGRRAGGIEEARKLIRETLDRRPAAWQGSYNAACFEALEQNPDAAFEHLRRALALVPNEVRRFADESSDLRSLHDDPRWQELFG
jgi:hypothetical protein